MNNFKEIKKEESFSFKCDGCGSCCTNRNDILLRPYEIPAILKELNISFENFLKKYCDTYIGDNSKLPIISIKFHKLNVFESELEICPFLKFGKCQIHKSKPSVCSLYPLGRYINIDRSKEKEKPSISYFLQEITCGRNTNNKTKLNDFLNNTNLLQSENLFIQNATFLNEYNKLISDIDFEHMEENIYNMFFNTIFNVLYGNLENIEEKNIYKSMEERYELILELTEAFKDSYKEFKEA